MTEELLAAWTAVLESALNGYLSLDEGAAERLAPLAGRVIGVRIKGTGLAFQLFIEGDRIAVMSHYDGEADAVLTGSPLALARLGLAPAAGDLFFSGDVTMEGDVATGQRFKAFLDGLDIDWEEHLARVMGDLPAHRLAGLARGGLGWLARVADRFERNLGEYLQEERTLLPARNQIRAFIADVDTLREDADRLDARVRRLERRLAEGDADS